MIVSDTHPYLFYGSSNGKKRYHLAFIDDDPWKLDRFRELYEVNDFRVTVVEAQHPASAVATLNRESEDAPIDLFVLDLFFPTVDDPPKALSSREASRRTGRNRTRFLDNNIDGRYIVTRAPYKPFEEIHRVGEPTQRTCL